MISKVLLLFKTHLDIGFTDLAENIINQYLDTYIPRAIKIGYELKDTDTPFIWSIGSWMVNEALKKDDGTVSKAIKDGIISWHALPFTSHTELMNEKLFRYGLSISKKLDKKFSKNTISAKMSDVPGHTRGMIAPLFDNGVKFLHIGVNPATPLPDVPKMFRWKHNGKSIVVAYNKGGYGGSFEVGNTAVVFGVTGDNTGPQTAEEIKEIYQNVKKEYPAAEVSAATLEDVALLVDNIDLPVIEDEIGDTWIHGAATDPKKLAGYRYLLRNIENFENFDFYDNLLLVPEHTCGLDVKTYFNYTDCYEPYKLLTYKNDEKYKKMEKSWNEQRNYVDKAASIAHLDYKSDIMVDMLDLTGFERIDIPDDFPYELSYQLFDNKDYERFKKDYMQTHIEWAIWDFTKVGLPEYEGGIYIAHISEAYVNKNGKKVYKMEFDESIQKRCGLPFFMLEEENNNVTLKWFGKCANKLPEAFWFKFKGFKEDWILDKMGVWTSPEHTLGNKGLHAVMYGVKNSDVTIETLDAALVAPFGRHLLEVDFKMEQDLYFNLYNNIWNTNFPMWYSDDSKFRFIIHKNEK